LGEAIEKTQMVYTKDYQNELPREVLADHMGYASLNGKSLSVLAAMLQYGLLEGRGDHTRVSDLALQIIAHPSGTSERRKAIALAAKEPDLFRELLERFPQGASDSALRSYLLTQKFIPTGAEAVIRAFRETEAFLEAEGVGIDVPASDSAEVLDRENLLEDVGILEIPENLPAVVSEKLDIPSTEAMPQIILDEQGLRVVSGRISSAKQLERLIKLLQANAFVLDELKSDGE
jgi:hypothetical protein